MFAAALPFPSLPRPAGLATPHQALSASVGNAIIATSFTAHVRACYGASFSRKNKPKRAGRKPVRRVAMQTVAAVSAPGVVSALPGELVAVADAVCMILGVGTMKRVEQPKAPTRPGKPALGIGADALARIRVDEASDAWCAVAQDIPKRARLRASARAKAWAKWEGTAGALA